MCRFPAGTCFQGEVAEPQVELPLDFLHGVLFCFQLECSIPVVMRCNVAENPLGLSECKKFFDEASHLGVADHASWLGLQPHCLKVLQWCGDLPFCEVSPSYVVLHCAHFAHVRGHGAEVSEVCLSLLEEVLRDPLDELGVGVVVNHPFLDFMDTSHKHELSAVIRASIEVVGVLI